MELLVKDDFNDPRRCGKVVGTVTGSGHRRGGRDLERVLSCDGGALRIQPLIREGWGRAVLSYGPFTVQPGLALGVFMLNGHNTSQSEVMSDSLRTRLERWAKGSGARPVGRRLRRWLMSGRVRRVLRQARWWARIATGSTRVKLIDENLAIGFYPAEAADPMNEGFGFVMHATGAENGELWAQLTDGLGPVIRGVQNVPICYVVVVRERDVLYLAGGLPHAHGLGTLPAMRPLAIGRRPSGGQVHASIHQSLLGQIGFRADSRVYGVRVAELDDFGGRWAGAHAAASRDEGTLPPAITASVGESWMALSDGGAIIRPASPTGLLRVGLDRVQGAEATCTLLWRCADEHSRWELHLGEGRAELVIVHDGARRSLAVAVWSGADEVQVQDDGVEVAVLAGSALLFGCRHRDPALAHATGVGFMSSGAAPLFFEAHPRAVPMPRALDMGAPWMAADSTEVAADSFEGAPADLEGSTTPIGGCKWRRLSGAGHLERTGQGGARWRASANEPLPERTIYAIDWLDEGFADLEVTLTPPGTARGQREHGTAGFCLWQDADNHLLVNTWLDDCYGGASLSSFSTINGFEDIYDAIWTNVGDRITWGRPLRLRLVSDGLHYTAFIDGEPVLYRALTDIYPGCRPLRITKVGLLGNWEWGADTGSRFSDFRASGRAMGG